MRKLIAVAVIAVLMSACGGSGSGLTPRSTDQLVLRIHDEGGFLPVPASLTMMPSFSLYADGTLLTQGPQIEIYPPPALPNIRVRKLTAEHVAAVTEAARDAGLGDGDRTYENNMVADASTTVFTFDDGKKSSVVKAYALGMQDESGARGKLAELRRKLGSPELIGEGEDEPYDPTHYQLIVVPAGPEQPADPGLGEPAPSHKPWPLETSPSGFGEPSPVAGMDQARCGVTDPAETEKITEAMTSANSATIWDHADGSYLIYLRVLLPDETGCDF